MASVRIQIYRNGHSTEVQEWNADEYNLGVATPAIDMLFASAVARIVRAEKFDAKLLTDRVLALLKEPDGPE